MTRQQSKRLIIDASVGRSAGTTSEHPQSTNCRAFLDEVNQQKLRLGMSKALRQEWKRHQSVFSQTWLSMMVRKSRVDDLGNPTDPELRDLLNDCANISSTATQENAAVGRAMIKDAHLLEAAFASEKYVIALDEKVRTHFSACVPHIARLANIIWVNPTHLEEDPIAWLRRGTPRDSTKCLSTYHAKR